VCTPGRISAKIQESSRTRTNFSSSARSNSNVLEDQQEEAIGARELEEQDAGHPVVQQESGDDDRVEVGPVAQCRDVGKGLVVDVQRLVIALVVVQRQVRESLEDGLVVTVDARQLVQAGSAHAPRRGTRGGYSENFSR
jgi:hypothetical protein